MRFKSFVWLSSTLLISACNPVKYESTTDAKFRFAEMGTYQITPDNSGKASVRIHPEVALQLNKEINSTLKELGYTKEYPLPPDFLISYRLESQWDPRLSADEIRQRIGFSGSAIPDADPRARNYQILSLVIEVYSTKEHRVVWNGSANGVSYNNSRSSSELVGATETILKKFPPR